MGKPQAFLTTSIVPCCFQLYYPNSQGLKNLLQALDTDSRLDLLPTIWKGEPARSREDPHGRLKDTQKVTSGGIADIRSLGHDNKEDLVLELLSLMSRDRHTSEVSTWKNQQTFTGETIMQIVTFDRGGEC